MTDKRNIVIQVKYPLPGKPTANLAPKMITEWNIKRIVLAASVLVLILASLFYAGNKNMQNNTLTTVNAVEKQVTLPTDLKAAGIKNGYIDVSDFWASPLDKSKKELNNKSK